MIERFVSFSQGMSSAPYPNATPGHASALNNGAGNAMHNMYSQVAGRPPFSNNAMVKPPYYGSADVSGLSPAEIYRQQHEVTATVCIFAFLGTSRSSLF